MENKKTGRKEKVGDKKGKPRLDGLKAQHDVLEELHKNATQPDVKVFSLSFNPYIVIFVIISVVILIYSVGKMQKNKPTEVTLGEFVENIKENKYSEVVIQNTGKNGKAIATSNLYNSVFVENSSELVIDENDKTSVYLQENMEEITLSDLVDKVSKFDFKTAIKSVIKPKDNSVITTILLSDEFVLAQVYESKPFIVLDAGKDEFLEELAGRDLAIDKLPIAVVDDLQTTGEDIEVDGFYKNISTSNYSEVWILGNQIIGKLSEDSVFQNVLDWGALSTDFPQLLQKEGISMDDPNVKIKSEFVRTLDAEMIIQILVFGAIIFLVFNIFRGMNGGGKGLMQFGQSKARIFFGRKPEVTFKDVAGVDSAKEELNEVVLFLKEPRRFMRIGARIPKGLLMVGRPGTGKTLLARAIAGEAGVPFFHTSGSEFEEMLVGAGASRVRDLFAKAKKAAPSLVFIDEVDAVARKRGTTIQSSNTEQTLNQILVEMDGFEKNTNVIVIAATNRPDVLDPAILRPGRFDRRIVIELPDIKGREDILAIHAKNKPLGPDVSLKKVARRTVGYSGADLENLLNEAAIIVAKDNRNEITFNDIEEAANRVTMGRERRIERTADEIKKTAYHEAGHAIVAKLTPESDPVHRITIVSRGMALGVTMQLPERDKYSQSFTEMESRLKVLMAGRAAEEIIYGTDKITSGATNDIEQATELARKMVKLYGYSKELGLVKYGESNELQYLGYGYGEQRDYSDTYAKLIDEEVKGIIDSAYEGALKILKDNKDKLEKLATDLVEKEVLEGEEFDKYFE